MCGKQWVTAQSQWQVRPREGWSWTPSGSTGSVCFLPSLVSVGPWASVHCNAVTSAECSIAALPLESLLAMSPRGLNTVPSTEISTSHTHRTPTPAVARHPRAERQHLRTALGGSSLRFRGGTRDGLPAHPQGNPRSPVGHGWDSIGPYLLSFPESGAQQSMASTGLTPAVHGIKQEAGGTWD